MKEIENQLRVENGYKNICGLDEVGRGCWAGPLVVAICLFDHEYFDNEINDSKKLKESERERLFNKIINNAIFVDWIIYDAEFVDKHNPKTTSIIGMEYLINKHKNKIDFCLIDAEKVETDVPNMSIIKGDEKSFTIAAASIVAKVIRDRIMKELDKVYPEYGFAAHKGYGTKKHLESLKKHGPIKTVHRFSYKPIANLIRD